MITSLTLETLEDVVWKMCDLFEGEFYWFVSYRDGQLGDARRAYLKPEDNLSGKAIDGKVLSSGRPHLMVSDSYGVWMFGEDAILVFWETGMAVRHIAPAGTELLWLIERDKTS